MSQPNQSPSNVDEKDIAIAAPNSDNQKASPAPGSGLDETYDIYKRHAGDELDPAEAKQVLRKVDRRILPILIVIYLLQYLDKNGINYASVYGLEDGTHLEGQVCCIQSVTSRSWT
jgi:hypothetical protein